MRRMRFLAFGIVSFVVAIVGTLLAPGTFVNRAFSAALCTLFSFNWTVCTVDLGGSSQRVVAANPPAVIADISNYLQAQRDPSEFGDDQPSAPSPQPSNPQAPPFPQDPGPNFPVRREFDDHDTENQNSNNGNQATRNCDYPRMFYVVYINGIQTDAKTYSHTTSIIANLLAQTDIPKTSQFVREITHNYGGGFAGDLAESIPQSLARITATGDGQKLIVEIKNNLTEAEKRYQNLNKQSDCNCKIPRPKFLLIAESQGNFFAEQVANQLPQEIAQRTAILSISSFTDYKQARNKVKAFEYLLRPDEIAAVVNGKFSIKNPGIPNLPPFPTLVSQAVQGNDELMLLARLIAWDIKGLPGLVLNELTDALKKAGVPWQQAYDSHLVFNYLGELFTPHMKIPDQDLNAFKQVVDTSKNQVIEKIKKLFAAIDDSSYAKDENQCSPRTEQPPQPQQTAQQQVRNCRVSGVEQYNNITMNRGECAIQGPVMTVEGLVDGKTQCGVCNTIIGNLPPNAGSCKAGMETDPRIAFLGLNKPILCPPNWDSGW
ncbi:MAG TPA: hypothetical protein V6D28_26785 [Leptolyngbyaceae cyanobacterium]